MNSKEIEDTYIRLDQDLARLFAALDAKVGAGEYTVFLTADHAAINVPAYLHDQKLPGGYLDMKGMKEKFDEFLKYKYGTTDVVKNQSNSQLFLDHKILANLDIDLDDAQEDIAKELLSYEGISQVYTGHQMWENDYTEGIPYILQNGYNQKRSGDVLIVPSPGYISYSRTGSTHGSPQIYEMTVSNRKIRRKTFEGSYNARARYTPDGRSFVFVHRMDNLFHIAVQNMRTGKLRILTDTSLDESPTISPNGNVIIYATKNQEGNILAGISYNGKTKFILPTDLGEVRGPSWSPILKQSRSARLF